MMNRELMALWRKYREIISYVIVGGLTTLVSMALFYGCTWTFLDGNNAFQLQAANVISWVGAVAFAYVTNRVFVFRSTNENKLKEIAAFVSSRLLTLLLDMAVMFILATLMKVDYNISKIIATVLVMIGNYVVSKLLVFR